MKNQTTTAKFNKSEIFKAAWSLVKTAGKSISEALKAAWQMAKKTMLSFDELVQTVRSEGDYSEYTHLKNCEEYQAIIDTCESMYPTLQGSEKQVKWAASLRDKLVQEAAWATVKNALNAALDSMKKNVRRPHNFIVFGEQSYQRAVMACKTLATQTNASFYINHRDEQIFAYEFIKRQVNA